MNEITLGLGWLERQIEATKRERILWVAWMLGVDDPELLAEIEGLTARLTEEA